MTTDQTGKAIPGIPLAALDAVGDANVRDVLRALVATHNVRNNLSGTGNEAFITTRQSIEAGRASATSADPVAPRLMARYACGGGDGIMYPPGYLSAAYTTIHISLDQTTRFHLGVNWKSDNATTRTNTRAEVHDGPGVVLLSQSDNVYAGYADFHTAGVVVDLAPGAHALTLHFGNNGSRGGYRLHNWGILLTPLANP